MFAVGSHTLTPVNLHPPFEIHCDRIPLLVTFMRWVELDEWALCCFLDLNRVDESVKTLYIIQIVVKRDLSRKLPYTRSDFVVLLSKLTSSRLPLSFCVLRDSCCPRDRLLNETGSVRKRTSTLRAAQPACLSLSGTLTGIVHGAFSEGLCCSSS